jgi:hypothetical protein
VPGPSDEQGPGGAGAKAAACSPQKVIGELEFGQELNRHRTE